MSRVRRVVGIPDGDWRDGLTRAFQLRYLDTNWEKERMERKALFRRVRSDDGQQELWRRYRLRYLVRNGRAVQQMMHQEEVR